MLWEGLCLERDVSHVPSIAHHVVRHLSVDTFIGDVVGMEGGNHRLKGAPFMSHDRDHRAHIEGFFMDIKGVMFCPCHIC